MSEAACGHTKIKEIRWNEDHATSSKFMCLDCNTDFVPLTADIRAFLWEKQWKPAPSVGDSDYVDYQPKYRIPNDPLDLDRPL